MEKICECGDIIVLDGDRDYLYLNGKYYCTDCMYDVIVKH